MNAHQHPASTSTEIAAAAAQRRFVVQRTPVCALESVRPAHSDPSSARRRLFLHAAAGASLGLLLPWLAHADSGVYVEGRPSADGIGKRYMGREIAGVMGWQGAAWLEREEREREERTDLLVAALDLKPGMVVADIGAGTGFLSRRMAAKVGPGGRVLAVDVQPEMVEMLRKLARQDGLGQIQPSLGRETDVRLAAGSVDIAVMVDVYHELAFPREVLGSIVRALKPGGEVVFVEYRAEDARVPIKPLHKMSEAQVRREAEAVPLVWERTVETLPWQHMVVFRKRR